MNTRAFDFMAAPSFEGPYRRGNDQPQKPAPARSGLAGLDFTGADCCHEVGAATLTDSILMITRQA